MSESKIPNEINAAFNRGCDARLAGRPQEANPYHDNNLRFQWKMGWDHVDRLWGFDAKGSVRPLPMVRA